MIPCCYLIENTKLRNYEFFSLCLFTAGKPLRTSLVEAGFCDVCFAASATPRATSGISGHTRRHNTHTYTHLLSLSLPGCQFTLIVETSSTSRKDTTCAVNSFPCDVVITRLDFVIFLGLEIVVVFWIERRICPLILCWKKKYILFKVSVVMFLEWPEVNWIESLEIKDLRTTRYI